jgi:hypothetical protein
MFFSPKYWTTYLVLQLGIFRRVLHPATTRGHPCALLLPRGQPAPKKFFVFKYFLMVPVIHDTSSIREPPKVS